MSFWVIMSWVFVLILTAINAVVFFKLKKASEQMLKMAFPGAKDMTEALGQMQKMMGGMGAMGASRGGRPGIPRGGDAQLKAAMDKLAQMQKKGGKR